jgi:MazG family protein
MTDAEMIDCADDARQLERLRAIVHRLRAPGGCPWDAEQTHESLVPNLVEEAYETVDTIRRGDFDHLREELGDLLLQVFLHSEIAAEHARFRLADVARGICDKLVRRHPHVFAAAAAGTSAAVLRQWDQIKRAEKGQQEEPYLHGTGHGLPALLRAFKLQKKAAKVGFDWPAEVGVLSKIREELLELQAAVDESDPRAIDEEIGDLLFAVVNLARHRGSDPEVLLTATNAKFERRFDTMEQRLRSTGLSLAEATLDQMEAEWQAAKGGESALGRKGSALRRAAQGD